LAKTSKKSYHQKEEKVKEWKDERLPRLKEKALVENRTIVYIDESAFSYCPSVCKTYSPKGVRPVLEHGFLRGGVQVISAISPSGKLYYQLKSSTLKGEDVAKFLEKLLYHFRSKNLLVIWDGAKQHSSEEVKTLLKARGQKRIHLEVLPPHSPQLNVDEQTHGFIKKNLLSNRLFYKIKDLRNAVIEGYEHLKDNPWLVHNFFFQKDTGFYPLL
jgi:transposase